jgi:hypothetical protein
LASILTGLTISSQYQFRYRAYSVFGWGPYNTVNTVIAAIDYPSISTSIQTAVVGSNVQVSWNVPSMNGGSLAYYNITLRGVDQRLYQSITYCDGTTNVNPTSLAIISNNECFIPMSVFWAAPFSLTQGLPI